MDPEPGKPRPARRAGAGLAVPPRLTTGCRAQLSSASTRVPAKAQISGLKPCMRTDSHYVASSPTGENPSRLFISSSGGSQLRRRWGAHRSRLLALAADRDSWLGMGGIWRTHGGELLMAGKLLQPTRPHRPNPDVRRAEDIGREKTLSAPWSSLVWGTCVQRRWLAGRRRPPLGGREPKPAHGPRMICDVTGTPA